jgi:hypothetical protein
VGFDASPLPSAFRLFSFVMMILSGRVVRICGVPFLGRFCHCEMEWTKESVIAFIELYERK